MKNSAFLILLLMLANAAAPLPTPEPLDDFVYTPTDYGGKSFTILHDGDFELLPDELNGEILSDAQFVRYARVEEMYNVKLGEYIVDDPATIMDRAVLAADDWFDVVLYDYSRLAPYAPGGYYYDINTIDTFKLDKSWWNRSINSQLEIAGRQFLASSEFTGGSFYNVSCLQYEREEYGDKLYDLAMSGRLTLDQLITTMRSASIDLSGEDSAVELLIATGYNFVEKTDDVISLRRLDDKIKAAADSISKLFAISSSDSYIKTTSLVQALGIYTDRSTPNPYSLLPLPKADEEEQYVTPVTDGFEVLAVPVMNRDPSFTGDICSALAYYGWEDFVDYEIKMFGDTRFAGHPGDDKIVEILFATRTINSGVLYGIGGIDDEVLTTAFTDGSFEAVFTEHEITLQRALDKVAALIGDMN